MAKQFTAKPVGNLEVEVTWTGAVGDHVLVYRDGETLVALRGDPYQDKHGSVAYLDHGNAVLDNQPDGDHTYKAISINGTDAEERQARFDKATGVTVTVT